LNFLHVRRFVVIYSLDVIGKEKGPYILKIQLVVHEKNLAQMSSESIEKAIKIHTTG
jgi:hypothetical protein